MRYFLFHCETLYVSCRSIFIGLKFCMSSAHHFGCMHVYSTVSVHIEMENNVCSIHSECFFQSEVFNTVFVRFYLKHSKILQIPTEQNVFFSSHSQLKNIDLWSVHTVSNALWVIVKPFSTVIYDATYKNGSSLIN